MQPEALSAANKQEHEANYFPDATVQTEDCFYKDFYQDSLVQNSFKKKNNNNNPKDKINVNKL